MKKLTIVILSLLSIVPIVEAESYVATHSKLVPKWSLVLPAVVNAKAYVSGGLAIEILNILADGVPVIPTEGGIAHEDGHAYPQSVETVIYNVNSDYLSGYRWIDGKIQEGPLAKYSLPCAARRIDIHYVVHLPDGTKTKEITVTSFEINSLEGIECATRTTERSPAPSDIVGRFVGEDRSYFEFSADKKLTFHAIPAVWRNSDAKDDETISGSGEWRLEKDTIIVTVRDDDRKKQTPPIVRKIFAFDVQGWFGLFLEIKADEQSVYALYYIPPEKRQKPNHTAEPVSPSRAGSP